MGSVKSKFDLWKKDFTEDYSNAYGDLSLPSVFEFYVRHEILLWESFEVIYSYFFEIDVNFKKISLYGQLT